MLVVYIFVLLELHELSHFVIMDFSINMKHIHCMSPTFTYMYIKVILTCICRFVMISLKYCSRSCFSKIEVLNTYTYNVHSCSCTCIWKSSIFR